jgi:hypothetical protein
MPVKIVVTDEQGATIRTIYGPAQKGFNRAVWDLRYEGPKRLNFNQPPQGENADADFGFNFGGGPLVLPGTYKVSVTAGGKTETQVVQVGLDPRIPVDLAAFRAQVQAGLELRDELNALTEALNRINSLKKQVAALPGILGAEGQGAEVQASYRPVLEQARALSRKLDQVEAPLYNNEVQAGASDRLHFLSRFHDRLQGIMRSVISDYGQAPSDPQREEMAEVRKELEGHLEAINQLLNTDVAAFNRMALEHGASTLFAGPPITLTPANRTVAGAGN